MRIQHKKNYAIQKAEQPVSNKKKDTFHLHVLFFIYSHFERFQLIKSFNWFQLAARLPAWKLASNSSKWLVNLSDKDDGQWFFILFYITSDVNRSVLFTFPFITKMRCCSTKTTKFSKNCFIFIIFLMINIIKLVVQLVGQMVDMLNILAGYLINFFDEMTKLYY